jgi:type III restriction enzyme
MPARWRRAAVRQLVEVVERYVREEVTVQPPANIKDLFLAPYYGWLVETLLEAIRPDTSQGESPEVPRYESSRGPGSTSEVDFWTSREVREVTKSHVNYVVADTKKWEQSAAYYIDTNPAVESFVKNAGLGFAIPYLYNGQMHDYVPDFIIRVKSQSPRFVILETKGYDPLLEVKQAAAERWTTAVNADNRYGQWQYKIARKLIEVPEILKKLG